MLKILKVILIQINKKFMTSFQKILMLIKFKSIIPFYFLNTKIYEIFIYLIFKISTFDNLCKITK
jgi:hypothetical protein